MKTIPSDLLQEAVGQLTAEFAPEAIYLFGSHAWGTPTVDSDLDFFVIVPQSHEQPLARAQRAHGCLSKLLAPRMSSSTPVRKWIELSTSALRSDQILHRSRKLYG